MYKLIKHRGIHNDNILENTYEAIKLALINDKYMGVEFDVRETIDHEFIIYHDNFYNSKLISNTSYKELPKYVPRLEQILKINSSKIFLIEMKNIESIDNFIKLLEKYKYRKIYVMSFANTLIKKIAKEKRSYKIGILNYILNTDNLTKELDFVAILNSILNENIINILKGKEVFSYGFRETLKYENVYYIVDK